MFSSVAHLARANPFNAPHLQLVHDGLAGPRSSPAGPPGPPRRSRNLVAAAVEEYSCEYGSMKFYALCGFGGVLSCGLTHTAVVPLDLVKCRMQVCIEMATLNVSIMCDLIPNNFKRTSQTRKFEDITTARNFCRKPNPSVLNS
ncbi:phosphate carrier protein, mitochondrial-like [Leptonychotes weddellii]|uniref:Solute carrier family 25 member 3 n=1 Tax=Leptonychotes weddellii TaxID=9713 RepID=A0A7F8QID8_LEPWE|nr:phosphate carrier protein, mitochondrial-like [Leptonychotes weddellii]XP_030880476.1 phosphate carrier protein, mitochondrial-like [Leptonychotes weddellii]